jgi:hypothetical protein
VRAVPGRLPRPASAVTSVAFVVAGAGILVARSRGVAQCATSVRDRQMVFALLVAGNGVGSFIQHGPHPPWQAYAHDLPLAAVLAFVATDAVSEFVIDARRRQLMQAGVTFRCQAGTAQQRRAGVRSRGSARVRRLR